jgi:hypothetical protein
MRWTCACLLAACHATTAPAPPPPLATVSDAVLGVALDVPRDWVEQATGTSHVFSGPPGTDAWYTTLTLQPLAKADAGEDLETAVARAYDAVGERRGFAWERRDPFTAAGRPALFYRVRFEHHETPREKACVLVDAGTHWLDLCYAATAELFASGLPVFEDALQSLSF